MSPAPESSDPVLAALVERDRFLAALADRVQILAPKVLAGRAAVHAAERRMATVPAATVAGIIAKLSLALECLEKPSDDEPTLEVHAVRSAIADLERLSREPA
ncbi:MAG: hypothetical protein IH999_10420 [Proteobacteria bacterium]|nr:hypothetical protein [Pseudomonadota bacterium]